MLKASDYNLSNALSGNWNPTNPRNFATQSLGLVLVATWVVFLIALGVRRGVPALNNITSSLTGGRVDTAGEVRVF